MAMNDMLEYLKVIFMVQLFYAFAITLVIYSVPAGSLNYIPGNFNETATEFSEKNIAGNLEQNFTKQVGVPSLVEVVTLVVYSGNIVLDLFLNFITAVPQMFTLLIGGFLLFFNVDAMISTQIKLLIETLITVFYMLGLVSFLLAIRSQGGLV